jgi:hypothetical protein
VEVATAERLQNVLSPAVLLMHFLEEVRIRLIGLIENVRPRQELEPPTR